MRTMQSYEVERKRVISMNDTAVLQVNLKSTGYKLVDVLEESDRYFTRRDIDYMKSVECLRIRQRKDFSEITYKPASTKETFSTEGIVAKRELNVSLKSESDGNLAVELLEIIGLLPLAQVKKKRQCYKKDGQPNITIAIDTVTDVGNFVEVEVMSSSPVEASKHLGQLEKKLGIDKFPVATKPYRDLVMEAKQKIK